MKRAFRFYSATVYKWSPMSVCWDELTKKEQKRFKVLSRIFFWIGRK